jgi:hypothetical protein
MLHSEIEPLAFGHECQTNRSAAARIQAARVERELQTFRRRPESGRSRHREALRRPKERRAELKRGEAESLDLHLQGQLGQQRLIRRRPVRIS